MNAIVFDLDGTLITSGIDFQEMRNLTIKRLKRAGIPSDGLREGRGLVEILEYARCYLTSRNENQDELWEDVEIILEKVEMQALDAAGSVIGIEGALSMLISRGYRIGILTRASRRYAESSLRKVGLDSLIGEMICRDDFPLHEAKPNPIALTRICQRLAVQPHECLIVGDHLIDHICAVKSGANFVGVLTGSFDERRWRERGVSSLIPSVTDLPRFLSEER